MVQFSALLDADIAVNLATFLPCRSILASFAVINKKCLQAAKLYLLVNQKGVEHAHPLEPSGRRLCAILEMARFIAFNLGVGSIPKHLQDTIQRMGLSALRTPAYMGYLHQLNACIYSYWDGMPATPKFGIFDALQEQPIRQEWGSSLDDDCKYWKSSRVHETLIFLFDRPDGAVLVSEDYHRVYLVLGQAQSIGDVANFTFASGAFTQLPPPATPEMHMRVVGVKLLMTLLPWDGKIVYDGMLVPDSMATPEQVRKALQAYLRAVDQRTLLTKLRMVPVVSKSARPQGLSSDEIDLLRRSLANDIAFIHAQKPLPQKGVMWVYRRFGYTEAENPNHMAFIMSSSGGAVGTPLLSAKLEPSIEEYVQSIKSTVSQMGRRPASVAVDVESAVAPLKALLSPTLAVHYYPPPSAEETVIHDATNPNKASEACAVCKRSLCADGSKLLACANCKMVRYCGKEHQKMHWKEHKRYCMHM